MRSKVKPLLFIFPALLYLSVFIFYPIAKNLILSFLNAPTPRSRDYFFTGLENYIELFKDPLFLRSLRNNVFWVLLSIAVPVTFGLILAIILAERKRSRLLYTCIYFIPHTVAPVIAAIVWRWIYDPNFGPLNQALKALNLTLLTRQWLANRSLVLVALNVMGSWSYFGFCVLIFMSGLQNISPSLYEAAVMDGASSLQKSIHITIPMLRRTLLFIIVYTIIGSLKFFDLIFVATKGGPNEASYVVGLYIYNLFISQGRVNYAATMSTLLTIVIMLFSVVLIRNIISEPK